MKISTKFVYLIPLFLILSTNPMFEQLGLNFAKPIIVLLAVGSFFFYKQYPTFLRNWYYLYLIYFGAHCLEAMYLYNRPLGHLHVSSRIMLCLSIFTIYGFYKKYGKVTIKGIMFIILVGFTLNMIFVNSSSLSLGAFLNHERGIPSEAVYLLTIPILYNFNMFLKTNNLINLFSFFLLCGLIFFFQHRTVWVTTVICMMTNVILIPKTSIRPSFSTFTIASFFVFLGILLLTTFILSDEKISEKIGESFAQIANPAGDDKDDESSTTEWRYLQFKSYYPYLVEYFWLGMRFRGFELPIQFVDHNGNIPFKDGTGHHFHSFYVDKIFYQGIVGLILLIVPPFVMFIYYFFRFKYFNIEQQVLLSYYSSTLIFGLSYNWPAYLYGLLGYTLYVFDKENTNPDDQN